MNRCSLQSTTSSTSGNQVIVRVGGEMDIDQAPLLYGAPRTLITQADRARHRYGPAAGPRPRRDCWDAANRCSPPSTQKARPAPHRRAGACARGGPPAGDRGSARAQKRAENSSRHALDASRTVGSPARRVGQRRRDRPYVRLLRHPQSDEQRGSRFQQSGAVQPTPCHRLTAHVPHQLACQCD